MATVTVLEDLEVEPAIAEPAEVEPTKHYEVVNDQIVEEPPLGIRETLAAATLGQSMGSHAKVNRLGRVVPEGLFVIERSPRLRRRPDIAFVSYHRWPANKFVPPGAAWDVIPDLAVEIVSPSDLVADVMDKIDEYFRAGVRLLWVVHPAHRGVYAYQSPASVRILFVGDELEGGDILPGFRLPLAELFEIEGDEPAPLA